MFRSSVVMLFLGALVLSSAAEARAGRGFRKSSYAPAPAKAQSPADAGKAAPTRGSVNAVVPVPIRRREPQPATGQAPPRLPAAGPGLPIAAGALLSEPSAAPRPWCESGKVVGGLCLLN